MRECIGAATNSRHADDNQHLTPGQLPSFTRKRAEYRRLLLLSASVAALAALAPRQASAQTWTGATSNDWTVGTNWSGGAAPVAGGAVNIVAGSNVVLGVNPGATGAAATMNVRDAVGGTTNLTIQNGSTLTTTGSVAIGDVAGGTATVTLTGAGSQWNASSITLFANATSVLNVTDGATVNTSARITVGTPAGSSTATLNVSNATILMGGFGFTIANAGGQINYDNAVLRAHLNTVNVSAGTVAQNNIKAGGLTVDTNGFTAVSAVGFSGVGGLTKTGAGNFIFGGSSTYTGETVIQQGSLSLSSAAGSGNALASSSRVVTNAAFDASISPDGNVHIQSLAGNSAGTVTLGANNLILTNANDTFSGTISGTGGVQVTGGTQAFSGVQAYSGATTIGGGSTLALTGNGDIAASSGVTADGTFGIAGLTGAGTSIQHLTGGGAVDLGTKTLTLTAANDTFSGVIGGAGGGLTVNGSQTLTGVNTYSGTTEINGGTLALTGNGSIASSRMVANGTFDISGVNAVGSQVASLAGTGTVVLGAKDLIINNANDTFAGSIGGSGGLQVTGGTQALSTAQAYTGATTIAGGTLALTAGGDIAASSQVIANGTFSIAGLAGAGTSVQRLSGSGAVDLGAKTLTIQNAGDTFSGIIGGSGGLSLAAGTQTLSGVNTYSGQTLIQGGTLALSGAGSIANSSSVVANGTFDISGISGASSSIRSLSGSGGVNLGAKTLTITAANDTFSGGISGSGGLTLTGGTQTLSSPTSYTGATTITGGTLALTGTGSLITSSQAIVNGTLDISNIAPFATSVQRLSGSGAVTLGGKNLTILSANDAFGGVISGSGGLTLTGGTQALSGVNSYADQTLIQGGTLALTGVGSIANSSSVVANGGFDISGIAGASASIRSLAGNGIVALGAKDLVISNAHDTFAGAIGGGGGLTVAGGTQTLAGVNTYTGATTISGGTLALMGAGSLAASSQVIANGTFSIAGLTGTATSIQRLAGSGAVDLGAKTLTLTNANDSFAGTISGTGGLTVNGTQTLAGVNTYSGATTLAGGTLRAGAAGAFSAASAFVTSAGAELDLNGLSQNIGALDNAGTLRFGSAPGTTLTVNGNYIGNGGTLLFNTVLGGDNSATDRLVVNGSTSGTSNVRVNNIGGGGVQTVEGIKLIDITGASNGAFSLLGDYVLQGQQAMVAGAYAYTLQKGGASTPNDGDWYLRSSLVNPPSDPGNPTPPPSAPSGPLYQPGVPLYENYAQVLLGMNMLPSMQERVGNRYWGGDPNAAMARMGGVPAASEAQSDLSWKQSAFWGRIEGGQSNMRPSNTTGSTYDADHFKAQAGLDGVALDNASGRLIVGLTAQYGLTTAYVNSFFGNGRIRVQGSGVGATATWYGDNGIYLDGQAQTMFYRGDLSSDLVGIGSLAHGNEGLGYAFSVEGGKRFAVGNGFFLTPQAQLAYSKVDFENFTDRFGALVSLANADSLLGRVGLMLNHQKTWNDGAGLVRSDIYAIGNLHYEFLDGTRVDVSGTGFASANDRLWGSIGGGGSYSWANGRYTVFGEATYRASLQNAADSNSYKGTAGFRVVW